MSYSAKVRFNKVCVATRGDRMVTFPDGGCVTIECGSTDQYVSIMYGDIRHETLGTCRFIDAQHGLIGLYRCVGVSIHLHIFHCTFGAVTVCCAAMHQ
jgi:hypothetical protein